ATAASVSYSELLSRVEAQAAALGAAGVGPGDCVALHAASGLGYIVLTYALWQRRACVVPLPTDLVHEEIMAVAREVHFDRVVLLRRAGDE
ncbi:hypothetical protein DF186_15880, partial [Enterococcus hirae]